jgi:membrane-associated phospholipid phosphatase
MRKTIYLGIAILVTYIFTIYGIDWWYFTHVRSELLNQIFFPAIVVGGILPILLPPILYGIGKLKKKKQYIHYSYLIGFSAFAGWFSSSFIKAFTGRIQPNLNNLTIDISNSFNFGFWEHGIFWGWPSSHTTVAFSVSFAILTYLNLKNKNKKIYKYIAVIYAFYIGIGVSLGIHWLSDFVAGALLGIIVGETVGKKFYDIELQKKN